MEENIFKWLRLNKTMETVKRGKGKTIEVQRPYSVSKLAREMGTSQPMVENAEKGVLKSLGIIELYHDYFDVPYSTLLGETDIESAENLNINLELGLTDNSISSIKELSPLALAMLNVFLSKGGNTHMFFYNLANIIYSTTQCLTINGNDKNDSEYQFIKQKAADLFMEYMHLFTIGDLKKILIQLEQEQQLINSTKELYEEQTSKEYKQE